MPRTSCVVTCVVVLVAALTSGCGSKGNYFYDPAGVEAANRAEAEAAAKSHADAEKAEAGSDASRSLDTNPPSSGDDAGADARTDANAHTTSDAGPKDSGPSDSSSASDTSPSPGDSSTGEDTGTPVEEEGGVMTPGKDGGVKSLP